MLRIVMLGSLYQNFSYRGRNKIVIPAWEFSFGDVASKELILSVKDSQNDVNGTWDTFYKSIGTPTVVQVP